MLERFHGHHKRTACNDCGVEVPFARIQASHREGRSFVFPHSPECPSRKTFQTDCRTDEGVTVGLIDSLISIARVLVNRDLTGDVIEAALIDLRSDKDVAAMAKGD